MSKLYPIFLNLKAKACLIVGGGKVATRKVKSLLESEANITVISPEVTDQLLNWYNKNLIIWKSKQFDLDDVKKYNLIYACTNDDDLNKEIAKFAKRYDKFVNIATSLEDSNFIVPSKLERGDLSLAISTQGKCPVLAKKVRKDLEAQFDNQWDKYLYFITNFRSRLKNQISCVNKRKRILNEVVRKVSPDDMIEDLDRHDLEVWVDDIIKKLSEGKKL
ncbi:precorrin-2 dehydrogenase/sirohydrochlorin ferrochelatase family protein [Natranaerobius trueperi]|uniref:precorrin-2 dehydrogenase/sirohydrochlorin ferrochelatase family protein n=1 Tax=Natranaerobius trueperi TaxID=759412 RepID=UPI001302EF8F|nr:bifunctional precorrin-2 dehydrogenase/sirohydrochlorin ferrochelatase [Natranaerobius trueperi]